MKIKLLATTVALLASGASYAKLETAYGTASADLRLRYENVEQDNNAKDADALTLRTQARYKTKSTDSGVYGFVEIENVMVLVDDFNDLEGEGGEYSVVADPKGTDVDQAYIGYKKDKVSAKLGRQVITLDNHRFVGHVAWRQDKQVYDALSVNYKASEELDVTYVYVDGVEGIVERFDADVSGHIVNASYKVGAGKLVGYGYLLGEYEADVNGNTDEDYDTFGLRYTGKIEKFSYTAEFATQSKSRDGVAKDFDATYMLLEAGTKLGAVNVKAGYEVLGSDDGMYGFQTPLATKHKFNGWADMFLGTPAVGLQDIYATVSGKAAGGKWSLTYHTYSADESTDTVDDLGSEINAVFTTKIADKYPIGVKYADYSADDFAVDTSKLWIWTGASF